MTFAISYVAACPVCGADAHWTSWAGVEGRAPRYNVVCPNDEAAPVVVT